MAATHNPYVDVVPMSELASLPALIQVGAQDEATLTALEAEVDAADAALAAIIDRLPPDLDGARTEVAESKPLIGYAYSYQMHALTGTEPRQDVRCLWYENQRTFQFTEQASTPRPGATRYYRMYAVYGSTIPAGHNFRIIIPFEGGAEFTCSFPGTGTGDADVGIQRDAYSRLYTEAEVAAVKNKRVVDVSYFMECLTIDASWKVYWLELQALDVWSAAAAAAAPPPPSAATATAPFSSPPPPPPPPRAATTFFRYTAVWDVPVFGPLDLEALVADYTQRKERTKLLEGRLPGIIARCDGVAAYVDRVTQRLPPRVLRHTRQILGTAVLIPNIISDANSYDEVHYLDIYRAYDTMLSEATLSGAIRTCRLYAIYRHDAHPVDPPLTLVLRSGPNAEGWTLPKITGDSAFSMETNSIAGSTTGVSGQFFTSTGDMQPSPNGDGKRWCPGMHHALLCMMHARPRTLQYMEMQALDEWPEIQALVVAGSS